MTDPNSTPPADPNSTPPATPPASTFTDPATPPPVDGVLGEAGKKALEAERAARKEADKLLADARNKIKEFEDRDKSETQKLQEERDALKAKADRLEIENLRRDVAAEKGIDLKAANRLVGTTREELEADADALFEVLKGQKPPFGTVAPTSTVQPTGRIYKQSELNNHAFYTANKADILAALKEGRITED